MISSNCGTTHTPLWRRSPNGSTICNKCGLYLKNRNTSRPANLKRPPSQPVSAHGSEMDAQEHQRSVSPLASDGATQHSRSTYVSAGQIPTGSCPGGGHCNGTGGADGCNGCPAYNNRVAKTTQVAIMQTPNSATQPEHYRSDDSYAAHTPQEDNSPRPSIAHDSQAVNQNTTSLVLSCQNCGTTITPLWRRDEGGRTICNACGELLACIQALSIRLTIRRIVSQTPRRASTSSHEEVSHKAKKESCTSRKRARS